MYMYIFICQFVTPTHIQYTVYVHVSSCHYLLVSTCTNIKSYLITVLRSVGSCALNSQNNNSSKLFCAMMPG